MGKAFIRLGMGIAVFLATVFAAAVGVLLGPLMLGAATFGTGMEWIADKERRGR
jgi:hypothetical protein